VIVEEREVRRDEWLGSPVEEQKLLRRATVAISRILDLSDCNWLQLRVAPILLVDW
jgi:hypothetical protein